MGRMLDGVPEIVERPGAHDGKIEFAAQVACVRDTPRPNRLAPRNSLSARL